MRTAAWEKATAQKRQWGKVNIYEIFVKGAFNAINEWSQSKNNIQLWM